MGERRTKEGGHGSVTIQGEKKCQSLLQREMFLNRALKLCGVTKKRWYHKPKRREMAIDLDLLRMIRKIRDAVPIDGLLR